MSIKKKLYLFSFFKLCIALSAILNSSLLFGGIVNNNIPGNDLRGSVESMVDSARCADLSNDSLKRFVRFDHTDGAFNYYSIRLSMFNSSSERGYFYQAAKASEIYMTDKSEFDKDSTLFMTGNTNKVKTLNIFSDLYEQTINTRQSLPFTGSEPFKLPSSPLNNITQTCNSAMVSCSGNVYTFPSGTTGSAPPPILGYPNYGCLGSEPCPAYYYMQVSVPGDIIILIQQGTNDVDFICWGPFNSLTDGCAYGLTGTCNIPLQPTCCNNNSGGCTNFYPRGNITDCSYSGAPTETCHILNAQPGQMYILLITNFSQQPGTITFQQTGGTGVTDCNIVVLCSMIAITANPSVCDGLTNTFSISGNVEFSNPPPSGTLTITDNTAVPPVSQTHSHPFVSPLPYTLTGIHCDGAVHSLTAVFSDSTNCTMTQQFTSPPENCPQAQISGGGEICNDGTSTSPINISLLGVGPFNFTYAIDGVSQPAINNYSGASPYVLSTNIPGTYTMVSISNLVCTGPGTVSGSATVTLNPLPVPTITGSGTVCASTSGVVYTTETGMTNYSWTVSPGGNITSGGGTSDNTVTVTWNTAGPQSVSINYNDLNGCSAASAFVLPITINPLPVPTISGNQNICTGTTGTIYSTQPGMSNYTWTVSAGGTITSGGTTIDNMVTVTWNAAGAQTVSVVYTDANSCTSLSSSVQNVTVNPLPVPAIAGSGSVCAGSTGHIYTTQPGMTNYLWNITGGGTITTGGTPNDNSATLTWNIAGPQIISVNYNDANGCTAVSSVAYNITVNPLPVPAIAGPASVCLNSTGTYSTAAGMTNYTWTVSAGGTITSGATTSSIIILWTTTGSKTITLNYNDANGCTAATATSFTVDVNLLPVPVITGFTQICVGNATTYTTDEGMTGYSWNLSAGGSVTSGGSTNDNTITIQWNSTGPQSVSVNYVMGTGCTAAGPTVHNVTVHPLPVPVLGGTNILCAGTSGVVYSTQPGMTNYQWVVSAGGTITAGGGPANNTATVTWNTPGPQAISVNFQDVNSCTAQSPVSYPVIVNPLPVPAMFGPASVCLNSTSVYSTDPGMTNYIWSVSPGGTITSGPGTSSITVLWSTTGAKTITVNYSDVNNCSAATPSTYPVNVSNLPVPSLNGTNNVCNGISVIYSTDAGMSGYVWTVSAGGIFIAGGGPTDNTATATWNTAGAQSISVNYQVGPGCTATIPTVFPVTVKPLPSITNSTNSSVCSATTLSITPQANLPGTTFSWTATPSSLNVSGFNSGSGVSITDHLVNTGLNIENVTYAVLPSHNGCDGSIANYIVTVNPVSDVTFTPNGQALCSGGTTNISLGSHVTGATFTWNATGSSGNISGFGPGAGYTISQTLINTGFANETATYHVLPTANSCPGVTGDIVITVTPSPSVAFTPCTDIITTTDAKPFTLRGGTPLGGTYSGTGVNSGIFFPSLAGAGTHTVFYSYTNVNGCSSIASLSISVLGASVFTCDNTLTDVRDNAQYPTVRIGTQCWMATNLNFGNTIPSSSMQRDNCVVEKYCFNDNASNCSSLGAIYQWDEMMQFNDAAGIQGLCPPAWHVPAEIEWTTLFNFYTSNGFAGSPLKSTGYSGFNALLTGVRFDNGNWNFNNFATFFWSSTSHGPFKAWAHSMNTFNPSVSYYPANRSNAFSVRCIQD